MDLVPDRIFPLGDSALTVEFGNAVTEEFNDAAVALADRLNAHPFPGLIEAVPAFASTTVYYNPFALTGDRGETVAFEIVRSRVMDALQFDTAGSERTRKLVRIPLDLRENAALDLGAIESFSGLSSAEVIDIFLSRTYRVFMLGFLPGFAYMGRVDERIAIPRRRVPRLSVPPGSVGIAGRQTGIYPRISPGGWQIIGRTGIDLLTDNPESPCLFHPGDEVRFERIYA